MEYLEIPEKFEQSIRNYLDLSGRFTEVMLELCEQLDPDRYADVRSLINAGRLIPMAIVQSSGLRIELVDALTEKNVGPVFEYGRQTMPPCLALIQGGLPN